MTANIIIRPMDESELVKIAEIDRSEKVQVGYEAREGRLIQIEVDWDVPTFRSEGVGEHTVAAQIGFCRGHLERGGGMLGAFDGERLAGIAVLTPEVRPRLAQLAYLHVSRGYRRQGIASRLVEEVIAQARREGAERLYVSATPSESAVGFYLEQGFAPVKEPLPELFELEPEDIHMVKFL
jgi:GNAT superfamily N-acetyltransferase